MHRFGMFHLAAVGCLLVICGTATAGNIISSNTGLSSPAITITFSEIVLADNTLLTNQYAGLGVTFSGGYYYNGCPTCVDPPPNGMKPQISDFPGSSTDLGSLLTTISLSSPSNGIAFNFAGEFVPFTFTAYLATAQVGQFTVDINTTAINGVSGWGWYGFDNLTLDSLQISTPVQQGSPNGYVMDNLELGTAQSQTPEPSTLILSAGPLLFMARRFWNKV
jgi:hypothetical protein